MAPIPGMDSYNQFHARAQWQLKFIWWPQTCELTGRRIWLEMAYRGQAIWTGPGEPVYEHRYHKSLEHIIWQLKH